MSSTTKDITLISLLTLILTFLLWLPFLLGLHSFWGLDFSAGFNSIYRNYDGLEYIVIAKSLYSPQIIQSLPYTMAPSYYASHFPGFSLLILLFSPMGFLKSMLFVSVVSTIGAAIAFYFLVRDFKLTEHPLFLSTIFLILPARWVIIHSVGSSEPTFILFTILSIYFFMKFEMFMSARFISLSALFGLLAILTRPPGILLFVSLWLYILWRFFLPGEKRILERIWLAIKKYYPLFVMPIGLFGIFFWYAQSYGDFWAYFHSGDNIHLTFPPFQVFNKHQFWVGEIWLEDIVYIFILGFLGGMYLLREKLYPMAFFVFTYLVATIMVAHRDISRYVLPIFPFVLIAFQKVLVSREFRIVLIIVALAIYLYAENFMIENTAPIPNLVPFN
jgi:hypothetical protein